MANIALVTANTVSIVESIVQLTAPAGEAIAPGAPVRLDATTGRFMNGNASTTTENNIYGIATGKKAIPAGWPVTAIRVGVLDGFDFSAQDYGENIFLSTTDASLGDAAGTTVMVVGCVIPGFANLTGSSPEKLLQVNIVDDLAFLDTTA